MLQLQQAVSQGEYVLQLLQPLCEPGRIILAGSIRRRCDQVSDVEIVCVPRLDAYREFQQVVGIWRTVKGGTGGRYTRRVLHTGAECDFFVTCMLKWPQVATIRTGCKDFSQALAVVAQSQGKQFHEGRLLDGGRPLKLREERQVFDVLGLPWYEPHQRTPEAAKKLVARSRAGAVVR